MENGMEVNVSGEKRYEKVFRNTFAMTSTTIEIP